MVAKIEARFKYYSLFSLLFLTANFTYFSMSPRIIEFLGILEPGGIFVFPFTFFFMDIIAEVYGYKQARQLIWISIFCLVLFVLLSSLSMQATSSKLDHSAFAFIVVFSKYPKALLAIGLATAISFLTNNYILAKLKILTRGKYYWLRSIIATSVGHAVFSLAWSCIFYFGIMSFFHILKLSFDIYLFKITAEIILTPFSAIVAAAVKLHEGVDVYDINTNFTFFSLNTE